ncbi:hypothetical protein CROQUDRAFT_96113 [Cronartium quercuum f. sp. fusiforme G11]|uniref:Glycosyltransferase family 31 protein n=1 Tax=Cronartium quercuum f. sp. fusiforme G11 TaxID=708437 RepID=A0A9P6NCV7_9BASI|nr:hypothetical protein CROQUDRAFT_96113 [Cronartium quercuum f. sp. fusiforme G11]
MFSRTFQLAILTAISLTFLFYTRRPKSLQLETFKSLDPRILIRSGANIIQDWATCETTSVTTAVKGPHLPFQQPLPPRSDNLVNDQDFCPPAGPGRRATAILIPIGQGLESWDVDEPSGRTFFVGRKDSASETDQSELGFLPFMTQTEHERNERRPARFNPNMTSNALCPVYYVPASALVNPIPPLRASMGKNSLRLTARLTEPLYKLRQTLMGGVGPTCEAENAPPQHSVQETALWHRRGYPEFMFGCATTPKRALEFLPRWSEWLPSSMPVDVGVERAFRWRPGSGEILRRNTASTLILTPPETELDQAWEVENAARGAGMDIKLKSVVAERYEARYMKLITELWREAVEREALGAPLTQWFSLVDDDTYFLSLDSVARMLAKYDPLEVHLIGSLSEAEAARKHFGNIAFGGAGIFLSRGLMKEMNQPGAFDSCVSLFAKEFGGDGMITKCAAVMMRRDVQQVVTREPTLHQLDIRDEGHGIFQAGWRFTSLHHWRSWFQLQPRAHPHTLKDPSMLASLLGNAARAVAPDNWTRRYVWGLSPDSAEANNSAGVVVSLGYSITITGPGQLQAAQLDKVELTFAGNKLTAETRPALLESRQRRTYYLTDLRTYSSEPWNLNEQPEVGVMTHVNSEGEYVDLVWDARPRSSKGTFEEAYRVFPSQWQ